MKNSHLFLWKKLYSCGKHFKFDSYLVTVDTELTELLVAAVVTRFRRRLRVLLRRC